MTTPVYQGYPDFARVTPFSDQIFANDVGHATNTPTVYGPFYVANIRAFYILFAAGGDGATLRFDWCTSSNIGSSIAASIVPLNLNTTLEHSIRPFTPWVAFTVTGNTPGLGTFALTISTMAEVNLPSVSALSLVAISANGIVLPAASSVTVVSAQARVGECVWNVFSNAGAWDARLEITNAAGVPTIIDKIHSGDPEHYHKWFMAAGTPQIVVTNATGAGAGFDAFLMFRPNSAY